MPTYRYRCAKCGDEIEEWQSFEDKPLTKHRSCGGKLAKVLSTPGIVLKGSGFYRTDNRSGSKSSSGSTKDTKEGSASDSSSSSDSKSGDSKSSGSTSTSKGDSSKSNDSSKNTDKASSAT